MKVWTLSILLVFSPSLFSMPLSEIKIEKDWKIKYRPSEWSYLYLKAIPGVSANIFEHKNDKIKLLLQKEAHIKSNSEGEQLLKKNCEDSNIYFSKKFKGFASIEKINSKDVCYVEFKNALGKTNRQFLYPINEENKNYEIVSYGWSSQNSNTKLTVKNFLKGFL